jgi:hypothetical protein
MDKIERVEAVVRGQSPDRPPVSFWHYFGPPPAYFAVALARSASAVESRVRS